MLISIVLHCSPRGRKSESSGKKSKDLLPTASETPAGNPLRLESMLSAPAVSSGAVIGDDSNGVDGPSGSHGVQGAGSTITSPTFTRMVASDSNNTVFSTASSSLHSDSPVIPLEGGPMIGTGPTSGPPPPPPPAAAPPPPQTSPVWPQNPVFSPQISNCLCNAALISSNPSDFAPPHSYRCRYGAFTRADLDIMINWIDARLHDGSYMSDADRLRFEWLRAVICLSLYLWAL